MKNSSLREILYFFKKNYLLCLIIIISIFFRFYKFRQFQYFGGDEEVLTATLRHIIWDRSPVLLVQNASLSFGLGPFYHYFLSIFYFLTNFDLITVQAIGSLLGVLTTILLYFAGKQMQGKNFGLLVSFLYAASFFIALFDRRVVHLTLNPFLSALTLLALVKIVNKDYRFIPLLALPIGFSFHEDASLFILVIAIVLSWIFLRLPVFKKQILYGLLILGVFALPFIFAEIHYGTGSVSGPIAKYFFRSLNLNYNRSLNLSALNIPYFLGVFSRALFTFPSNDIEKHFFYDLKPQLPIFSPVIQIITALIFVFGFISIVKKRALSTKQDVLLIPWIMILAFLLGISIFTFFLRGLPYQHYFTVIFPIYLVIVAQVISLLFKKYKLFFFLILFFYLLINLYALINSSVSYPLYEKIKLIDNTLPDLKNKKFNILTSTNNPYAYSGGWTELYTLKHYPAAKSYWYKDWYWIYAAYSLFPEGYDLEASIERIVYLRMANEPTTKKKMKTISQYRYKDIILEVKE